MKTCQAYSRHSKKLLLWKEQRGGQRSRWGQSSLPGGWRRGLRGPSHQGSSDGCAWTDWRAQAGPRASRRPSRQGRPSSTGRTAHKFSGVGGICYTFIFGKQIVFQSVYIFKCLFFSKDKWVPIICRIMLYGWFVLASLFSLTSL